MNSNAWIIWNELVKSNFDIDHIIIHHHIVQTNSNVILLEIEVQIDNFESFNNFSIQMFKKHCIDINFNNFSNSFKFELAFEKDNEKNFTFEKLEFPPNVNNIQIIIENLNQNVPDFYPIKFNLPEKLSQLKIISAVPVDLTNLPTNLFLLDISETECKLNLDYLPDSIKILYLPNIPVILKKNYKYLYKLSDLSNLPSSLIEIHICYEFFESTKKLIEKFDEKTEYLIGLNHQYKPSF